MLAGGSDTMIKDRKIDRLATQDAYWYAECVEEDGHGDTFQVGPRHEFPTVLAAWRKALDVARKAGIDLRGLDLLRGKLLARGRALRRRISEARRTTTAPRPSKRPVTRMDAEGWTTMALCNSPNFDSRATVTAFLKSPCFVLSPATTGVQEFLSRRFGRWFKRNERGLCRDSEDFWAVGITLLTRAVVATGRYTYDADRDAFVPTAAARALEETPRDDGTL
jgi:hypothetical protein